MSSKGWKPNSRRNRRNRRRGGKSPRPRGSDRPLFLVLGLFTTAVIALLALIVYGLW